MLKNFSILSLVEQEFERVNHLAMTLMDAGYDYSMEPQCDPTFVKSFVKQLQTTSLRFSKEFHISGLLEWAKTNGHVRIRRLLLKLIEDILKNGIKPALEMALSDEWYTDKGTDKVTDKGLDKGTDKRTDKGTDKGTDKRNGHKKELVRDGRRNRQRKCDWWDVRQ